MNVCNYPGHRLEMATAAKGKVDGCSDEKIDGRCKSAWRTLDLHEVAYYNFVTDGKEDPPLFKHKIPMEETSGEYIHVRAGNNKHNSKVLLDRDVSHFSKASMEVLVHAHV